MSGRRRFIAARTVTLLVVGILSVAFVSYAAFDAASRQSSATDRASIRAELDDTRTELSATRADLDDQFAASTALTEQVESLGEEPVVNPASPPRTSTGIPIPGVRGPAPSFSTVLRAVMQVCDGDACDGDPGQDGSDGSDGESITGPQGQPGESITGATGATVAKGDSVTGPAGKDGANGKDGRGISALDCTGTLTPITLTLTYTDGTTSSITCQPGAVEPEPAPEPTE